MTNQYPGLARGPIDHASSSVINMIANGEIQMGSAVTLTDITGLAEDEILPRVDEAAALVATIAYGIAVGGDEDGIYGSGAEDEDDGQATTTAGQGIVIVTQGRCLARVHALTTAIVPGLSLSVDITDPGVLSQSASTGTTIAIALQNVAIGEVDMIAVDVQREGLVV